MTISKAHWDTDGENVRLSMPINKVDAERRIVSGFATLDNIDRQADIVTTDASLKAFANFRGNIREMHQPKAVGKMVSFKEDKYFDAETKKFYSGVYVSAYISKGAQDAWEKVLDGTYTGFSIGGKMNKWDDSYDEKMDASIRVIKDYDLMELSLVDSPANQFANIISVEKADNGQTFIKGDAADLVVENVFWDKESGLVTLSEEDTMVSPVSGNQMQNIGFVEKDDSDKKDMVKFLVDSAKGINTSKIIKKENDNMTDEIVNDEVVEVAPEAVAEEAPVTEEVVEEAAPAVEEVATEEVVQEAPVVSEEVVADAVAEAVTDIKGVIVSAFSDLTAIVKSLNDELAELKKSVGYVDAKIADAEGDFSNLGKRIDAVEADTAFRKSGDLGEIVQEPAMVEKSLWGGSFLTTSNLLN